MNSAAAFVFGKLPTHGDFVGRGLSAPAREAWDAWAGPRLDVAREQLGDGFEAAHEAAPPWRFALPPADDRPGWQAGALAPSIDRVGRRFLIVVGAAAPAPLPAVGVAAAMEGLIYDALAQDWTVDTLHAAAGARLADLNDDPADPPPAQAWVGEPQDGGPRLADMFAPDALLRMLKPSHFGTPA
ncbi:type VI secretion system-associated protein TagF [Caulobacter sp. KR2-114]|uniref:type VI secretion system-associated protein TagF n=1 Tax=Caulobacter sp. KR2-114 TaxID=3400912 RepID=UPI003C005427